ncbi:MAG: cell division ATP-binding protein FtsE [Bacteroidetes bacterium]|nr:cell division ATP-binding protein FtsE [Rhodothermia bacterium]MCS7155698.1 cell division ATP-binding protein FtsE [Bacteroidota bacterium]MCX7906557.1 cell division ATP-binding protein FtsE [Bacteroidota bacterium]MDW8137162.1 cell division ATP-binding protein FtsE [Bacteroidota bacterium]MDW8284968.1 cell division ATP-binding protein FtsE [Bacteroidota bacterium]
MSAAPIIVLDRVRAGYEGRPVLQDVSLRLERGEFCYLIGPTGSGKSTLLKLLYMDLKPMAGLVQVGPFRSDTIRPRQIPYLRRRMGIVFQDFQLLPDRSVFENVAFPFYVTGRSGRQMRERVLGLLAMVGLSHKRHRMPHELSGGEQQRVAIARALAHDPEILLADEPTGNLDPHVSEDIMRILANIHKRGVTVFMATHDYTMVRRFPARTVALVDGRLVEVNPKVL